MYDDGPSHPHSARFVAAIILAGTAVRAAMAATTGLGVDESYAVAVARTPSWSYFDHPGLSFWIPGLLARAAGTENALLVRAPFILMFAGTTWLVYRLGARLSGGRAGACAALLLTIAPVFSVAFGGWVLPDGPLDLFAALTVLALVNVFDEAARHRTRWWLVAGLGAAFAALSKYQAIFLPLGLTLYLATRREARRALAGPGPPAALALAALGTVPTLAWNAAHWWASFAFQFGRGAPSRGSGVAALLRNLGGQAMYLLPWLWLPLIVAVAGALRRGPSDGRRWLLACMAAPPIAFFTLISLGGNPGLPHWPMIGYLAAFPLLGELVARRLAQREAATRRWLGGSIAAFGVVLALAWSEATAGWMTRLAPRLFARGDPTLDLLDWTEARSRLAALGVGTRGGPFVAAVKWTDAAKIAYALGPGVPVVCLCGSPHQFGYLADARRYLGRDAVIVDRTRGASGVPRADARFFAGIEPLPPIIVHRAGRPALSIQAFFARRFVTWATTPPPSPPSRPRPRSHR